MAKHKDIQRKIEATQTTRKITRAMKMVAFARLEKTRKRKNHLTPYMAALKKMVRESIETFPLTHRHPYCQANQATGELLIAISGDRGLCGSYNQEINRALTRYHNLKEAKGTPTTVMVWGKKVARHAAKEGYRCHPTTLSPEKITYDQLKATFAAIADDYLQGTYHTVKVLYQPHCFTGCPPRWVQLLPAKDKCLLPRSAEEFPPAIIQEPHGDAVLAWLLDHYLITKLYKITADAQFAEHRSRMIAMTKATDNTDTLIRQLTLAYNRARQESITRSIIEISAGRL